MQPFNYKNVLFYIVAAFSDECTGHTWSDSVAQGCVSRALANLPVVAELRLWSLHHLFARLHSSTDGKWSSATDLKWWVKVKACVFELQLLPLQLWILFLSQCMRLEVFFSSLLSAIKCTQLQYVLCGTCQKISKYLCSVQWFVQMEKKITIL